MNNDDVKREVATVLSGDSRLAEMWSQEPSAISAPFKQSRVDCFLLVSLCLRKESINLIDLTYVCLTSCRLLLHSGLLSGLSAVEIVPYLFENERATRILRFSVTIKALESAIKLSGQDMLDGLPAPGVRCEWYIPKPK
jgi:hypothetical protein